MQLTLKTLFAATAIVLSATACEQTKTTETTTATADGTTATPQTPPTPAVPLTVSDEQSTALLDDTLGLLSAGLPDKSGAHGQAEIERWVAVLEASDRSGLAKIKQELGQLGELLSAPNAQSHDVAELLGSLSAETAKVADEADNGYSASLTSLSTLLRKAANSLSR